MATQPESKDALFIASDSRSNFKQVIAKRSDLVRFAHGRMKYAGAGLSVTYNAGLVLGYATSGGDAGFLKPYASGNSDGSQVPVGILADQTVTDEFGNGSEARIIKSGDVYQAALIGLDSGAITAMKGSSYVESGVTILSFLV